MFEDGFAPFVSVVVALRNEVTTIERCLRRLLDQDYPFDRYEIIVADGASDDGSRDAVLLLAKTDERLRLVDNPQQNTPFGFNAGIRAAEGDVVVIMGAHTFVERDFLREGAHALQRTGADAVGGVLETRASGGFGVAVAEAVTSPFGVGRVAFRMATEETEADTAANAAYRREVFERVGLFDEELVRDQDDEFNHRLRAAGGRIVVTPRIRSTYTPRSSPAALWRQYFAYGFYKVRVFQKHPRMMKGRHFVPAASVAAGAGALLAAAVRPKVAWLPLALATPYAAGITGVALRAARNIGYRHVPSLIVAFPILHFGYGAGFLAGLVRFFPRWWKPEPAPPRLASTNSDRRT